MYSELIIEKLKNKNIAILGFGKEGKSTYKFIRKHLPDKHLTIIDKNNIEINDSNIDVVYGDNYLDNLSIYDLIIKTPGISFKDIDTSEFIDKITSELELLLEVDSKNIIGVTGTKGKSTTSTLLYEVIKHVNNNVYLLGNIGNPIFDYLDVINEESILVIEMSSHQLEYVKSSPHIAVLLNLYEDHLDHAGTLLNYHNSKMNIFKYQTNKDYAIYSSDDYYTNIKMNEFDIKSIKFNIRFDNKDYIGNDVRIENNHIYLNKNLIYVDNKRNIIGNHNLKNIMFVLTVCKILNINIDDIKNVIEDFKGLKYRMEYIGIYHDIKYYVDTIATIPSATEASINAIKDVDTLIFGGMDRGIDYSEFIEYLKSSNISNLICMPTTGTKIGKVLESTHKNIVYADTLEDANNLAIKYTKKGMSCLLSPAAASYEYFKNFEEKGNTFINIVKNNS